MLYRFYVELYIPSRRRGNGLKKFYRSVLDMIGETPMTTLNNLTDADSAETLAKLEMRNPGGSVKDRIGLSMILDAERRGAVRRGSIIVEPTAGNTGIALAVVAKARGYRAVLTMPDNISREKIALLRAFGAEAVLTPASDAMVGAIWEAEEIARAEKNAFMPNQFSNPANPATHQLTTGQEIIRQTDGRIDAFVCGVGTGGTLTGVARALKERGMETEIVAVEPSVSPAISGGPLGPTRIDGLGAGFKPEALDADLIVSVETVEEKEAYDMMRALGQEEGLLTGMSSGAAAAAALRVAKRIGPGKRVVTILADTGDRYLSLSEMFE